MDYRQRIYERYASLFMGRTEQEFDKAGALQWGRAYKTYLRDWLPKNKDAAIADLACGYGNLLYVLQEQGYTNLAGVDMSPDQVKMARQIAPAVEHGDVLSFLQARPASFDLLTAFDLIEHLAKDEVLDFLDACHAALKPGGRLILQTPNAANPWVNTIRYGDFTHEVCFEDGVLGRLMRLCHFEGVESREMGPVARGYSLKSSLRYLLWRGVRAGIRALHTIETGSPGSNVLTRVFLISATKH